MTDIHSHPVELARALSLFREHGVDQVVTIGDTIEQFAKENGAGEVAGLLLNANAVGVWGNHDFGLRGEVVETTRARLPAQALTFMARMLPRLVIGHCHFSHRESSADPNDIMQLWDLSDPRPDLLTRAAHAFAAVPARWQFVGHYHRWWAATPNGAVWQGDGPLVFDPTQRYFVIVGATCEGWCAILDLDRQVLEPLWCGTLGQAAFGL